MVRNNHVDFSRQTNIPSLGRLKVVQHQLNTGELLNKMQRTGTIVVILGVCVAFIGAIGNIQAQQGTDFEKAQLWIDGYELLPIRISSLSSRAGDIGLTRDRLQAKVESRLRQAEITPSGDMAIPLDRFLYVNINATPTASNISVKFYRRVRYTLPNGELHEKELISWATEGLTTAVYLATPARSAEFVIENLDRLLDAFLSAYLKANKE